MLIIPHIFNFILEKNRNKTKNEITEPHLPLLPPPPKKEPSAFLVAIFFFDAMTSWCYNI